MKRVKSNPSKKATTPEATIQAIVDLLLQTEGIPFLRLPDNLFRAIHADKNISGRMKAWILHELSGWADNIAFIPIDDKFCLCCHIENKSDKGKLRGKQKVRSKEIPYNIVRTETDIRELIKLFTDKVKELQK
jgi:hypothetical protein